MQLVYGRLLGRSALPVVLRLTHKAHVPLRVPFEAWRLNSTATVPDRPKYIDLRSLDRKWQQTWETLRQEKKGSTQQDGVTDGESMYILPMFPYPSGYLHMGHVRVYTIADVMARFRTLQGNNVLLPMGWDAFGLPAENAAIERGINPAVWTKSNIAKMKEQLGLMNGSWDWSNELATCDPEFYKHTQKIFLLLHEKGLAYQAEAEVNYDPVDKTVLANEQVDANGCSWRSGAKVEKRKLKQWFLRISEFRVELLQGLDKLAENDAWPERVLAMQKNWLGRSTGALIKFPLMAFQHDVGAHVEVFTTRPDTLFGVQYLALAATHPIVKTMAKTDPELQAFLDTLPGLPPDSKVGYLLPHVRAINPLAYHEGTPDENKASMPIYVAPYVLGDYGEGAVMGVPGHDVRDHAFWREHHYDEPIRIVLSSSEDESTVAMLNEPFVDHGIMTASSGPYKGKSSTEAGKMLVTMLEEATLAKSVEKWRLRDWLISRQRYWGTPIPIIHCGSCGAVPVPDDQLPVALPEVDAHWAERKAGNPLETLDEWVNTSCPKCGGAAKRDTDTMDTFVDSSWYYMRFVDVHNKSAPFSAAKVQQFLPVDLYIGGIEHAILHLLYSRFIYKFLIQSPLASGIEKTQQPDELLEPFKRLITQGMVQGKTYTDPSNGRFLKPEEVNDSNPSKPFIIASGETPNVSFEKMSKSKYNGVDPTDFIARYGADATRAHMIFQAAAGDMLNWDEDKVSGVTRWLQRVWMLVVESEKVQDKKTTDVMAYFKTEVPRRSKLSPHHRDMLDADVAVWREVQKTIDAVTGAYEKVYSLNTVVSNLMTLTNTIHDHASKASPIVLREALASLLQMASPITPAFAEECWSILRPGVGSIFSSSFPVTDGTAEGLLVPQTQKCAVQVNGKFKGVAEIPVAPKELEGDGLRDWVVSEVLKTDALAGNLVEKVKDAKMVRVVGGGKLVNFVLGKA